MRLATRLATTGVAAALALGGLLTTTAQAAPDRSSAQPTSTARASGFVWCNDLHECRQKRNYYLYLGCSATPVEQAQWHPGNYHFNWRC